MSLFYINPNSLDADMKALGANIRELMTDKGKSIEVNFKLAKRMKTHSQLGYYNILLKLLYVEIGYTKLQMDCTIKDNLGYYDEILVNGVNQRIYKSKAGCSIEDATIFVNTVMSLCDEMGINYMLPEDYYESIRLKHGKAS